MTRRTYILHAVVLAIVAAAAWVCHAPFAEAKELIWRKPPAVKQADVKQADVKQADAKQEEARQAEAAAPGTSSVPGEPEPKRIDTPGGDAAAAKETETGADTADTPVEIPTAEETQSSELLREASSDTRTGSLLDTKAATTVPKKLDFPELDRAARLSDQSASASAARPAVSPAVQSSTEVSRWTLPAAASEVRSRPAARPQQTVTQPRQPTTSRTVAYQVPGPTTQNSPLQSAMVAASGPRPYPFKYMMASQATGPEIIPPGYEIGPGGPPGIYADAALTPAPLLDGWDGAVWPDEEVGSEDATTCCGFPLFLSGMFGVQGFKGPADLGRNGNFGINPGFNFAGPSPYKPVGFQVGMRFTENNVHGDQALGEHRSDAREQIFLTAGIFRRADCHCPWQWSVVFDWMHDEYWYDADLSQVRFEISRRLFCNSEIGVTVNLGAGEETNLTFEDNLFDLVPTDLYTLFVRWPTASHGDWRIWGGVTGESDGLFGGDFWLPLNGPLALEGNFNFLFADQSHASGQREDSYGIGLNLVWYPCRSACGVSHAPLRPVLPVADNSRFFVDTVRKKHNN